MGEANYKYILSFQVEIGARKENTAVTQGTVLDVVVREGLFEEMAYKRNPGVSGGVSFVVI